MATTQKSPPARRSTQASAPGGTGAKTTRRQNAEKGFVASKELGENMQAVLVDLLELQMQGKQAHWNVVGRNFRDTHRILDEIIEAAREFSDTVAERMRALHAVPDGRSDTVAATTTLPEYPQGEIDTSETVDLITVRLENTVATMRERARRGRRGRPDERRHPARDHREARAVRLDGQRREPFARPILIAPSPSMPTSTEGASCAFSPS